MVWVHQTVVVTTTMKMEVRQAAQEGIVSEERNDLSTKWDVKIERCSRSSGLFRRNKCKKVL